jgi:hypothetical protein
MDNMVDFVKLYLVRIERSVVFVLRSLLLCSTIDSSTANLANNRGQVSYRNKTYVIFDGDNDMWAYAFMKGWKSNENMDFNFYDAHDIRPLTDRASEDTVKRALRERFSNAKQVVVLVGENTRNLYRFVRWEIEIAEQLNLPIIVVNLNDKREMDSARCPPILRQWTAVHVAFKAKIIQLALDRYPEEYSSINASEQGQPRCYSDSVYTQLGLTK